MTRTLTFAAAAILAAAPAHAQNPARSRTELQAPTAGQVRSEAQQAGQVRIRVTNAEPGRAVAGQSAVNDGLFAAAAADGGLTELTLSQLGVQKATDPELKRFSQLMLEEHTRMNNELTSLAAQKGMRVPDMVNVRSQFCAQSLAGLSGEEFDHCYAKAQLLVHMDAVATFEAEAKRGTDPDVKALAAKALPHIKSHLKMIKPIAMKYEKEDEEHGKSSRPDVSPGIGPPSRPQADRSIPPATARIDGSIAVPIS